MSENLSKEAAGTPEVSFDELRPNAWDAFVP